MRFRSVKVGLGWSGIYEGDIQQPGSCTLRNGKAPPGDWAGLTRLGRLAIKQSRLGDRSLQREASSPTTRCPSAGHAARRRTLRKDSR
jgi:hypothetical protein